MKYTVGIASLLMGAAHAATIPSVSMPRSETTTEPEKLTLVPVSTTNRVQTAGRRITPQKNLNMAWQTPDESSLVEVGLSMQNSAVLLEDIEDISAVDCTGQASVAITFNNTDAFNEALTEWSALNDSFVIITNHMGDCDSELERSFFVADTETLTSFDGNLTIVARAEKSDVASTASE